MKIATRCALFLLMIGSIHAAPNILFILADDMGWTGTSAAMDDTIVDSKSDFYLTPNIEALAASGMRFSHAYAPAALCTPSRAAILTGKTPAELHITTPGGSRAQNYQKLAPPQHLRELPESTVTIAEILQKQGYATAHFGKWHLGRQSPGLHGFDVHDGSTQNEVADVDGGPKDVFGLTERAIAFMTEQTKAGTPFYLQLSHYAVHTPVETLEASKAKFSAMKKGEHHRDVEYAGMTYDLDTSIGRLLQHIDTLKITENTYVVFMSDNGAASKPRESQNAPLNSGKGSLYEGGIRVPLIISGQGIQQNSFCDEPVTGCDLFATFSEWAGVRTETKTDGSSLVPLARSQPEAFVRTQKVFLFHYPHYGMGPKQKPQTAIIVDNFKLLKDLESGNYALFDLATDPMESKDLFKKLPEKAETMQQIMETRLLAVDAQQPTVNLAYDPNAVQTPRRPNR